MGKPGSSTRTNGLSRSPSRRPGAADHAVPWATFLPTTTELARLAPGKARDHPLVEVDGKPYVAHRAQPERCSWPPVIPGVYLSGEGVVF